jgi:cytochrome subunit of sulfide dehydrogenase
MLRFSPTLLIVTSCIWLTTAHADVHIRSLAGSCAACHGTNGNSVAGMVTLAGMDAAYFSTQMFAFKNGTRTATVMHRHTAGLTQNEIEGLAQYFAIQSMQPPSQLKSVQFK